MDKDKSVNPNPNHSGGFPPPSGRFTGFPANHNVKPEPGAPPQASSSSSLPPLAQAGAGSDSSRFSHDVSRMPDNPPKNPRHRRAHSEILTLPDDIDISFDNDIGMVGGGVDGPSFSDETEEDLFSMYLDMDKFSSGSATSSFQVGEGSSGAAGSFTGTMLAAGGGGEGSFAVKNGASGSGDKPRIRHQHSQSMDGSTSIKPEMLMSGSEEMTSGDSKKAMSAAKLAELALVDPKRAKRIWANRQSAARSKERKMRYIAELERKLQTLQTEATTLSAQLSLLQRDTNGLTAENSELKLRLQTMEQQVHLQDALNDALKEEIQHLKVMTGQAIPNGGPMMNYAPFGGGGGGQQQFYQNPNKHAANAMNTNTLFTAQQFQQLQIQSQKQQQRFQQHQMIHLQQQLQQQQQQQQSGDLKLRGTTQNQKDNNNSAPDSATKD